MMITDKEKYQQLILEISLISLELLGRNMRFELLPADHNCQQVVLLYTHDCLNDYFKLKALGLHFTTGPLYTARGLMVEFTDTRGNCYKMLEERYYDND
jgi:hypothetical protein